MVYLSVHYKQNFNFNLYLIRYYNILNSLEDTATAGSETSGPFTLRHLGIFPNDWFTNKWM